MMTLVKRCSKGAVTKVGKGGKALMRGGNRSERENIFILLPHHSQTSVKYVIK